MKQLLVALFVLTTCAALAQQQPRPLSVQDAANAAEAASGMSAIMNKAPAIDAQGRVVAGQSSGAALGSGQGLQDGMRLLQGVTGIEGVSDIQGAGQAGLTGAKARMTGSADFNCLFERGARKSIAGVLVRLDACTMAPGSQQVTSVSLGVCESAADGAWCSAADFVAKADVPANTYSDFGQTRVGIGCADNRPVCRITVTSTYSVSASGATLRSQSEAKAAALEGRTVVDGFRATYTSDEFAQKYTTEGVRLKNCVDGNEASAADGQIRTCDGSQVIRTRNAPDCTQTRTCTRTVQTVSEYTRSCIRTFPLTTWHCNKVIETKECTVTVDKAGTRTSDCTDEQLSGAELVATVDEVCAEMASNGECAKRRFKEQYAFSSRPTTVGECYAEPLPLAGPYSPNICAQGRPEDLEVRCASDGWFGRTLSDNECIGQDGLPVDFRSKPGCGMCVKQEVGETCYASAQTTEDSCGTPDALASCVLTESVPEAVTSGLVISRRDTFTCRETAQQCVEWAQSVECANNDITWGTNRGTGTAYGDTGTMTQALAQAGVLNAIQQSINEGGDAQAVRIFSGKDSRCRQPVGFLGFLSNDCCRINLERPGGSRPMHRCTEEDVKLAAARRSNFTVYIGDYCSSRSGLFRRCKERTQTYCAFPGLLPRIVQEQGRAQLAQLAGSSAGAQVESTPMQFSFYAPGNAQWGTPVTVNGVTVVPWQQARACASLPGSSAVTGLPTDCGNLTLWLAVCERPQGCSRAQGDGLDLPAVPEIGSQYWIVAEVNPLRNVTTVVSRYAAVKGACAPDTGECRYVVSAWPAGVGGRAILARPLSFPLYEMDSTQTSSTVMLGDYMLRGISAQGANSPGGELPATVQIRFSDNAGASWSTVQVPSTIDGEVPLGLSEVRIAGGCNALANVCDFRVVAPVSLSMKPWGSPQSPDCSGFTAAQISVLDFSKMDLSEWLRTVRANLTDSALGGLAAAATRQAQAFGDVLQSGNVRSSPPTQQRTAVVSPVQDFGPFTATVSVSGFYPYTKGDPAEDKDPVHRVEVDWGDCTETTVADPVGGTTGGVAGNGFRATHTYPAPDKVLCSPREDTLEHTIKVTIYASSGVYVENLKVRNVWRDLNDPGTQ
jgi:hypothetical protein